MTYATLAALFVLASAVVVVTIAIRIGLGPRWWLTTGVTILLLLILTVVFDSLMILADLFRFDEEFLLGMRVWRAPVEDLAWPLAAGLLLPAVHALLSSRREVT